MSALHSGLALFLLLTTFAGLFRVFRGPLQADRLIVTQLFGTNGVAILLLLAQQPERAALRDVALIFALLAAITAVAFTRLGADSPGRPR